MEFTVVGVLHRLDTGDTSHGDVVNHHRRVLGHRRDVGHVHSHGEGPRTVPGGAGHVQRVETTELASREDHDARAERRDAHRATTYLATYGHPPAPGCIGGTP